MHSTPFFVPLRSKLLKLENKRVIEELSTTDPILGKPYLPNWAKPHEREIKVHSA